MCIYKNIINNFEEDDEQTTTRNVKRLCWFTNCATCSVGSDKEIKTDSIEMAMENRKLHNKTTGHDLNQIWVYSDLIEEGPK